MVSKQNGSITIGLVDGWSGIISNTSYEKQRALAVFDLDNTLLSTDSDYSWTEFLISKGHINTQSYRKRCQGFYDDYCKGELDIDQYIAFITGPMQQLWPDALPALQQEYVQHMRQAMPNAARALVAAHRERGDFTMIMTATCNVITEGICQAFGVHSWKATMLKHTESGFTGTIDGTPCFQEGKRTILTQWMQQRPQFAFERTWFYSDSHNDLPLLEAVGKPVAVDPDSRLQHYAHTQHWPVVSLRGAPLPRIPYA